MMPTLIGDTQMNSRRLTLVIQFPPRRMATVVTAAALTLFLLFSPLARGAGLVEDFSYGDGFLTDVSGGAWQRFDSIFAGDALVNGGEAVVGDTVDVIRQFPAVLDAAGTRAAFSFSINIGSGIHDNAGYVVSVQPASPPFGVGTINYASSFGVGFLGTAPFLETSATADIFVLENGQMVAAAIGEMSTDAWHTFTIGFERTSTAPNVSYSILLDGSLLRTGTFHISDPRALNSVEMNFATGSVVSNNGRAHIDDIQIVPPPAPARFTEFAYDAETGFTTVVELEADRSYHFEASTNLSEWITLTNILSTTNLVQLNDPLGTVGAWRFYRVVSP